MNNRQDGAFTILPAINKLADPLLYAICIGDLQVQG